MNVTKHSAQAGRQCILTQLISSVVMHVVVGLFPQKCVKLS
ncbi:hypothetical protein HMPREF1584_01520 [Gardnerella vaginalis JCP8481A]|uniref:Uncharacterized protein n=1 Tax=Gardnerella vaginalis TaxID=2702 RepID=A0A133NVR3_GARVA|nr:hypothetical protein HMPREF1584_01520 [Gardnerella vaginalis JCP8481A]KXA20387.1 hypothetical protein HMPREF3208_00809 [Gardnerella vaginalis]